MAKYTVKDYEVTNGSSDNLGIAIRVADNSGFGYRVYSGKTVVYEQALPAVTIKKADSKILAQAKVMTDKMKTFSDWFYSNSGCSAIFDTAIATKNHKSNCATLPNWIYRKLKITSLSEYFYGKMGGTIAWGEKTEKTIKSKCDVFPVNKTVAKALEDGILLPGDVCCYPKQHTNIFAGGTKWYEAGTVYGDGSSREGAPIKKFYGGTVLKDSVISWVVRWKDPAMKERTRTYRTQCGVFSVKANANNLKKRLNAAGFVVVIKKVGSNYVVQTGLYSVLNNAVNMYDKVTAAGFPCMIVGL